MSTRRRGVYESATAAARTHASRRNCNECTATAEPACCAVPDTDGVDEDELPDFTFPLLAGAVGFEDVSLLLVGLLLVVLGEARAATACRTTVSVLLAAF